MPSQIRPNRLEVSDRFPMLGFTIKADGENKRYEIAIASDAALFGPDGKSKRTRANFYSSRVAGLLPVGRGETVYVLPPEILRRPKRGFAVPVAEWFRGDVDAFARETLLDETTRGRGFFDVAALETILGSHARGKLNIGPGIWSLLMFELWCREVLD